MNNQITTPYGTAALHWVDIPTILHALGNLYQFSPFEDMAQEAANAYYRIKGQFVTSQGVYTREYK